MPERLEGGLVGLLVGDALGVPYEFKFSEELPPAAELDFEPPRGFDRSHPTVPPGTWSDDGAQALCLLESLLECGRFDPDDFGYRLVKWYDRGHLAVGGDVFDVGTSTERALSAMRAGIPALEAGERGVHANGNGALMRVLPLALWHAGSDAELVRDAQLSSLVTHGHPRSQQCCALYCLWARHILREHPDPWGTSLATLRTLLAVDDVALRELDAFIRPNLPPEAPGSGYVVDTLRTARELCGEGPYETVVRRAVALGDDTDTTAAVAGGIAGVRDGVQAIPRGWRERLRGRELFEPLLAGLLARG